MSLLSSSSVSHPLISIFALTFLTTTLSTLVISQEEPGLNRAEQEAVYSVLHSINPDTSWRSLYPDDLCFSAPHGVVCDYFFETTTTTTNTTTETLHITELSFGYVSDYTPNTPCTPNSTLTPTLFTAFPRLRKLFFYNCFAETRVLVPDVSASFGSSIEELVFIENPGLVGPLSGILRNYRNLRRVVLSGNGFYGEVPSGVGELVNLEEFTVTGNKLGGNVSVNFERLGRLRVLDLSRNDFEGMVPGSIGRLGGLLKLDLSYNRFTGKIPDGVGNLQRLEFLDLSFNRFGNFGVPLFLGGMPRLREVYLSGNLLGGEIPEIWEKLGGILGVGFSRMGLVGNIPGSMGVFLGNLCYLGLDNNKLEGVVPREFGLLKKVSELNLENNRLSGEIPFTANFTARVGEKLKLGGNAELCVSEGFTSGKKCGSLGYLKKCNKSHITNPVLILGSGSSIQEVSHLLMSLVLLFLFL